MSAPKKSDIRVDMLAALLKEHQELVYRQENVSKYFGNDSKVLNVAANCWEQIHDRVGDAIKEKYHTILEEFQVLDKLDQLQLLERAHQQSSLPAWRPSGNPEDDLSQAAGAVIRVTAIPEFEKMYAEVQNVTNKLQDLIKERQQELAALQTQISDKIEQLNSET